MTDTNARWSEDREAVLQRLARADEDRRALESKISEDRADRRRLFERMDAQDLVLASIKTTIDHLQCDRHQRVLFGNGNPEAGHVTRVPALEAELRTQRDERAASRGAVRKLVVTVTAGVILQLLLLLAALAWTGATARLTGV